MQVNGRLHESAVFFLRKVLWYSMNRGVAGTQSWCELGKEQKSPFLYWDIISVIRPVA
jgi:hypothetical protein